MRIRARMVLLLTPVIVVMLLLITVYTQVTARKEAWEKAKITAEALANKYSTSVQTLMANAKGYAESNAALGAFLYALPDKNRTMVKESLLKMYQADSQIAGMGLTFLDFDGRNDEYKNSEDGNKKGQVGAFWSLDKYNPTFIQLDFDQEEYYQGPTASRKTFLTAPYVDADTKILMVTFAAPIQQQNRVVGVATADISLAFLSGALAEVRPYETGHAMIVDSDGLIIGHRNHEYAGKIVMDIDTRDPKALKAGLASGQEFMITGSDAQGNDVMSIYVPFTLLQGMSPWYYVVVVEVDQILSAANNQLLQSVLLCAAGIILTVLAVYFIANSIARPLDVMARYAQQVAAGHYDEKVDTKGYSQELLVLSEALKEMISSLLRTMQEAQESKDRAEKGLVQAQEATEVASRARAEAEKGNETILKTAEAVGELLDKLTMATSQLNKQIDFAADGSRQQQELVVNAVTAMEEMNSAVFEVARNSATVASGSEQAKASAESGADIVKRSITAIQSVEKDTQRLHTEMNLLDKQANSIGNIMTVISDIADQTNLLALNAAIEAARAGDAGRGFAVVADEVRKLAEKTMQATQEVAAAITGVQQGTERSIKAVNDTATALGQAISLVNESEVALNNIVSGSVHVADQVREIATAAEEQSATSEEIARSLTHINTSATDMASSMSESVKSINDLTQQAQSLQELMEKLKA